MSSNTDKCVVLRQHPRQARDREHLRSVSHQRDLGVIVDEALKPHRQSTKAAKSENSIMRAIKASFMNITPSHFISYMELTWRPWLREDIKLHSTKLVKGLRGIEYEERAQLLNLDSLSCRMDMGDMILIYKILCTKTAKGSIEA